MLIRSKRTGKDTVVSSEKWQLMIDKGLSTSFVIIQNDTPAEIPPTVKEFLKPGKPDVTNKSK